MTTQPNPIVSASPTPVTINGDIYSLSPFTVKDLGELDLWIQCLAFRVARAAIPEDLPSSERQDRLEEALQTSTNLTWADAGLPKLQRLDVLSQYLWTSFRKSHPKLSPAIIAEQIKADPDSVPRIFEALTILAGGAKFSDGGPEKNV